MMSTLSSIFLDDLEPEEDNMDESPIRGKKKKKKANNHAHFDSSEYRLENNSHDTYWLDPKTAGVWPHRESLEPTGKVEGESSAPNVENVDNSAVQAIEHSSVSVSLVLFF